MIFDAYDFLPPIAITFQHAAHLEQLLEENKSLTTKDLHDSGVRTLCVCYTEQVDLHKVF